MVKTRECQLHRGCLWLEGEEYEVTLFSIWVFIYHSDLVICVHTLLNGGRKKKTRKFILCESVLVDKMLLNCIGKAVV
jgi:hypothetical protein